MQSYKSYIPLYTVYYNYKNNLKNYEFEKGVGIDHCNKKQDIKIMYLPAVAVIYVSNYNS